MWARFEIRWRFCLAGSNPAPGTKIFYSYFSWGVFMRDSRRFIQRLKENINQIIELAKRNKVYLVSTLLKDTRRILKQITQEIMLRHDIPASFKKETFNQISFCKEIFPILEQLINEQFDLIMNLLILLEKTGFISEVRDFLSKMLKKAERNKYMLARLVMYTYDMGYYDLAVIGMEKLKNLYGSEANLIYNLALAYYMIGKTNKANELVEALLKRGYYFAYGLAIAVNIARANLKKANEASKRFFI